MNWYGLLPPNVPHPTGWLVGGAAVSSAGERCGDSLDSRHDPRPDEPDSLGWFFGGHRIRGHRYRYTARRRHRPVTPAGQPARCHPAPLPHRHTCGPARLAARRAGPEHAARCRRVRRRPVGRTDRTSGGRAAARRRHSRQRGDLRRLVRLGQRRPVPSRPEPGASVPQTPWRIHVFATLVQPWRHRRHHAARGRHPRRPVQAIHRVGGHRRAHRSPGLLRWPGAEEHRHQPRWHHRPPGP